MTDALNEIKKEFENDHPEILLTYNFGSSGKLVQQIDSGAPADVFISAGKSYVDKLEEKNLIIKDSRFNMAKNELVLIENKEQNINISSFQELAQLKDKKIAIGNPESVPAGKYAEEVFTHFNMLNRVKEQLVMGSDVRQVLAYIESGNAEVGIVYASDALISEKVKVLATSDATWHSPIVYPCAIVKASTKQTEAELFLTYLKGEKSKKILQNYGFK
jgi:molybdate transport system substrate-binding protein